MTTHEFFMHQALALAERASGCTHPNPLVGSVVVRQGVVVGEGWHKAAGQAHAEAMALQAAGLQSRGATLYATLEPCAHQGRTPPCTRAIVAAGIRRVVYAVADPNPLAAGGAAWLAEQGLEVIKGVCEVQARYLNRFFLHHLETRRPWVIVKTATSLDGRVATRTGHSQWITGEAARTRGHDLRQAVDAILVGAGTVLADQPSLTVRLPEHRWPVELIRHPRPIVLDSNGRIPANHPFFATRRERPALVATTAAMSSAHRAALEAGGVQVQVFPDYQNRVDIDALAGWLGTEGVQSLLVEGGPTVQGHFHDRDLIDEVWAFIAPMILGGDEARSSFAGAGAQRIEHAMHLADVHLESLGPDVLMRGVGQRTLAGGHR